MRQILLSLLTFTATISFSQSTSAQTNLSDTTTFNLGRLQLKKEFTQSITIKGEDLEKMPFNTLNEAINSWTYGTFTNAGYSNTYVIDGNLMNDVNAYSIHDIKEITLVQNALVQISGADRHQQLVLITTRRGNGRKQGLTVSGQDFLTNYEKTYNDKSNKTLFQQYTIGAWKNWRKVQVGASVNYVHNKTPQFKEYPGPVSASDRFRITAWMNAQLGAHNELYAQVNTSPLKSDGDYTTSSSITEYGQKAFSINPTVGWRSHFSKSFSNELSVGYLNKTEKGHVDQAIILIPPTMNLYLTRSDAKTEMVLVRENIRYTVTANNWRIEPAINLTFRYLKSRNTTSTVTQNGVSGPVLGGPNPPSYSVAETKQEGRIYLLTPSLALSYKSIFHIQGGMLANLTGTDGKKINRIFPFVSTTVNVLPPNGTQATSVQVFGSYAKTDYFGDGLTALQQTVPVGSIVTGPTTGPVTQFPDSSYWNWQTGARVGLLHNRISLNYNFEQRDYTQAVLVSTAFPTGSLNVINFPAMKATSHHINVDMAILQNTHLQWRTGITATHVKTTMIFSPTSYYPNIKGDDANSQRWTGGWVNRFSAGRFSIGLDFLYDFNKDTQIYFGQEVKVNALTVQNVYIGYNIPIKGMQGLELYAATRNLAQHYRSTYFLGGNQQYYGLGFKATL